MLDSMSCGCPLIASNTPPVTEFVKDGENGILFDFYNIEEQVRKIEFALDNRELMKSLRINARKTITENYALKDLLPKHLEYIKSVANSKY